MPRRWPRSLLRIDVLLALFFEQLEGQSAIAQNYVVKFADVEFGAQFQLCFLAQLDDFKLAHLVGERLAGPGDITIDLGDRFLGRVLLKKGERLFTCPAH